MGNTQSPPIVVLVLGLTNVGKTHFLDRLVYQSDTTKLPTIGFYQISTQYRGQTIDFVEYGGDIPWSMEFHKSFDHVIMIVDANYSKNQLREAKSALAMALTKLPNNIPLTYVIKGNNNEECVSAALQMQEMGRQRKVAQQWIEKKSWEEGTSTLLEWIVKQQLND